MVARCESSSHTAFMSYGRCQTTSFQQIFSIWCFLMNAHSFLLFLPLSIMLVLPDAVSDYGCDNDGSNNSKHWPDFQNPLHGCMDEESAEHQHECSFQNTVDPFLWWLQASTPPVLCLLGLLYCCTSVQDSQESRGRCLSHYPNSPSRAACVLRRVRDMAGVIIVL